MGVGTIDPDLIFTELLTGEGSGLILIGLAVAFLVAIFLAITAGWFRIILSIASFAYPSARVRAMGNPLVTKAGSLEISGAGDLLELFERAERLGHQIGYREGISPDDTERLIRVYHYTMLTNLGGTVPDAIRPLINGYIQVYQIREVAVILRGLEGGLPKELIESRAVPIASLTDSAIRKAAHSATVEEAVTRLHRSGVVPRIRELWTKIGETSGFSAFESALISDAYRSLMMAARGIEESQYEPAVLMAGRMIDCENLRILIRGRLRGMDASDLMPFLIQPGGFEITELMLRDLVRTADLTELFSAIRETAYGPYIEPHLEEVRRTRDPGRIELSLSRCILDIGRMISSQYHLGSGPIIRYLVALQIECENLGTAAAGLMLGVSPERIGDMMVMEAEA
jgi:vacuolar-type H+-ATPase subunit C/Vma6